jgi:hypothetical protein
MAGDFGVSLMSYLPPAREFIVYKDFDITCTNKDARGYLKLRTHYLLLCTCNNTHDK